MTSDRSFPARPDKREHFLNRARVAAERSTCLRRKVGAVVIRDGVEISSGYVGAPRGMEHCTDTGRCLRMELKLPSGVRYELCRSVHAEQNAIINAARTGVSVVDGEMYIYSRRNLDNYGALSGKPMSYGPCIMCKKEMINAGIRRVYMLEEGVGEEMYDLYELMARLEAEERELRLSQSAEPA